MKKCVLQGAEPLTNELGEAMFSGTGNRKYQSTGAITTSIALQMRNKAGAYYVNAKRPTKIPKGAIGSIFSEESAEFKVESYKSILRVDDLSAIELMKETSKEIIATCKHCYDKSPQYHFEYNGDKYDSARLSDFKEKVRNKNNDVRNQIIGQVRSRMGNEHPSLIEKLVNRAYTNKKVMISPISVVINVQMSHNVFSGNYAVKNVNLDELNLSNYKNTNGTYSSERDRGLTFTIPCHSMEHASQVCDFMYTILDKAYNILSKRGFERLVDTNHRTEEQIANDEQIVARSRTEAGLTTRSAEALDEIVDETSTSEREVLEELGIIPKSSDLIRESNLFSNLIN